MTSPSAPPLAVGIGGPMGPPASSLQSRPAAAEQAGFASMWWADHYMGWLPSSIWDPEIGAVARPGSNPDTFFDPVAAMAAAAVATTNITLGVTTEAVRRHPAGLALEMLTLQHISNGRIVVGIGAGEGENLIPYGIPFERPVGRLEEAIEVIRLLWNSDGPVDYDGDHFKLHGAVLGLPSQGSLPQLWVMGMGPRMCRLAGILGDGWLPVMIPADEYADRLTQIRAARATSSLADQPFTVGMFAFAAVAPSVAEAEQLLAHPFIRGLNLTASAASFERYGVPHPLGAGDGLLHYIPSLVGRDEALAMIDKIPPDLVRAQMLYGSPDDIRAQLAPYIEAGLEHIVIQNVGPLADPASARVGAGLLHELVRDISQTSVGTQQGADE